MVKVFVSRSHALMEEFFWVFFLIERHRGIGLALRLSQAGCTFIFPTTLRMHLHLRLVLSGFVPCVPQPLFTQRTALTSDTFPA